MAKKEVKKITEKEETKDAENNDTQLKDENEANKPKGVGLVIADPDAKLHLKTLSGKRVLWTLEEARREENLRLLPKSVQETITTTGISGSQIMMKKRAKK